MPCYLQVILCGRGLIGAVLKQKQGKWSRSAGCTCWRGPWPRFGVAAYTFHQQAPIFQGVLHRLMDKELTDRAAAIHDRLMQLRDSL